MYRQLQTLMLCAIVVIAGCARSGSSSAERAQDSTPSAPSNVPPAPAPPATQDVDPTEIPVPNFPDPNPTGWSEFDNYFQQLLTVNKSAVAGTLPEAELKDLYDKAQALAANKAKEYEASQPTRDVLAKQVRDLIQREKEKLPMDEQLRMLQNIVQFTLEVLRGNGAPPVPGYMEKIESMKIALENSVVRAQKERAKNGH